MTASLWERLHARSAGKVRSDPVRSVPFVRRSAAGGVGVAAHGPVGPVDDCGRELLRRVPGLGAAGQVEHVPRHRHGRERLGPLGRAGVDADHLPITALRGVSVRGERGIAVEHHLDRPGGQLGGADGLHEHVGILAAAAGLKLGTEVRLAVHFHHAAVEAGGGDGHEQHALAVAGGGCREVLADQVDQGLLRTVEVAEAAVGGLTAGERIHYDLGTQLISCRRFFWW